VDVLEATARIVGDFEAEKLFEQLVPGGWQVMNGEVASEKLGFQFEAKKNVEVVGNFISFDTDEGTFYGVGSAPAILRVVTC
jgi:hypothetical protein